MYGVINPKVRADATPRLSKFILSNSFNNGGINIGINAADKYTITLEEGKWTDYSIPLSTLTSVPINEIWVKEYNGTGGFTIYVDAMGLN